MDPNGSKRPLAAKKTRKIWRKRSEKLKQLRKSREQMVEKSFFFVNFVTFVNFVNFVTCCFALDLLCLCLYPSGALGNWASGTFEQN